MSISPKDKASVEGLIKKAGDFFSILEKEHPEAKPLLNFRNPFELLIATILSAQCTDERVNLVTVELFLRYPDPHSLARAPLDELEELVRSTGFFRNKAKGIRGASQALVERFGGNMPGTIEELTSLPGVGRKTANVVAGRCFGVPAVIVDTHFRRVAVRLGLSKAEDPDKIEMELRKLVPEAVQTRFSQVLNFHGRYCCKARKPDCPECAVAGLCPYPDKTPASK